MAIHGDCRRTCRRREKDTQHSFAEQQACKVFPAYRKITGIDVERLCPEIVYTLYERSNWPNGSTAGGLSLECRVDYLAEYALSPHAKSAIGPYEVHEILHQYQMADETLEELTTFHPLFASSMLEVEREIGDMETYQVGIARMKDGFRNLRTALDQATIAPTDRCRMAQTVIEEDLYLHNTKNVYQFYRMLANDTVGNATSRLSAMLNTLSGGSAKQFMLAHGCEPF
jgi:hypothetical protein